MTIDMAAPPLDVEALRSDFPIFKRRINGRPLIYLDSAAIDRLVEALEKARRIFEVD